MPRIKISTVKFTKGRVFVLGFFMVMLLAIPTTVYLVGQQVQTSTKAEKSTTLAFSPISKTATTQDKVSFDIVLSPGTNLVNYVKLAIKYDPAVFSTDAKDFIVNPSSKLKLTQAPTIASGSVTMVLSPANPTDTITTESKLGSITFQVIATSSTEAQLSFDPTQTQIRSLGSTDGVTENVFLNGTPANIKITGNDNTGDNISSPAAQDTPTLTSPSANEKVPDQTPAFQGTAKPNSTVSITIHSSQAISAQVQSDSNGNWTYTPSSSLSPGTHTITISSTDSNGILKTITQTFSVLAAQAQAAGANAPTCSSLTSDVAPNGNAPYTVGFTATGSDSQGTVSKVTFTFGDGGILDVTQGEGLGTASVSATASHTYQTPGTFNANAVLTNNQGGVSDSSTCTLAITVTGSSTSGALSPLPKTGPSPAIVGLGALGGIIFLIGALFFFVL